MPVPDDQLRRAYDVLAEHADDIDDRALKSALRKIAIEKQWEELTADEIVARIRF